jgi:lipoprotein-anchoring transpeptidase ErfK/SrfK
MNRLEDRIRRLAAVTGVMMMAAAEAFAQENAGSARRIVVSIPDRRLAVVEDGQVIRVFRTAVGRPSSPSPTGTYRIVQRIPDPTWYTKGRIVPPGKANPLGTRWLGLSVRGYGIHGTNNPASIGRSASHGCIRMRNSDVEELFDMVSVGDSVELYDERTEEVERIFGSVLVARASAAGLQ